MIVLDEIEQGSEDWHQARVGIPTASNFDKLITTKGDISKSRKKLLYQLAGEKLIGAKEEGYTNAAMERGIELESEARLSFEMITDLDVKEVGLCFKEDDRKFGCSPDGLIGDDAGLEIKCPSLAVHVEYLIADKLPTAYFQQVMGSLYVTGRERWHFFSYFPGMKPFHIVVERDEIWIAKLSKALDDFNVELSEVYEQLKEN